MRSGYLFFGCVLDVCLFGYWQILIEINDVDVVVFVVLVVENLLVDEIWIIYGIGKYLRYFVGYEIVKKIGQ